MPLVCTSVGCTEGRAAVARMLATFADLQANYPAFKASSFAAPVQTIKDSLDAEDSWYATWIPFNPTCCVIADLGVQADALTNQMLNSVGASPLPELPAPTDWASVVLIGGVILLLVVYSPTIKKALP